MINIEIRLNEKNEPFLTIKAPSSAGIEKDAFKRLISEAMKKGFKVSKHESYVGVYELKAGS